MSNSWSQFFDKERECRVKQEDRSDFGITMYSTINQLRSVVNKVITSLVIFFQCIVGNTYIFIE